MTLHSELSTISAVPERSSENRSSLRTLKALKDRIAPTPNEKLYEPGQTALERVDHMLDGSSVNYLTAEQQRRFKQRSVNLHSLGVQLRLRNPVSSLLFRGKILKWNQNAETLAGELGVLSTMARDEHDQQMAKQTVYAKRKASVKPTMRNPEDEDNLQQILAEYLPVVGTEKGYSDLMQTPAQRVQDVVDIIDISMTYAVQRRNNLKHLRARSIRLIRHLCKTYGVYPISFILDPQLVHKTGKTKRSGSYGSVCEGEWDRKPAALKEIHGLDGDADNPRLQAFCKEAAVWKYLQHENITPFYGLCVDITPPCLVSAWMKHGDLPSYLLGNEDADRMRLISGIANGLAYLHELGIVHGDVKGCNVLVNKQGEACLADFGMSICSVGAEEDPCVAMTSEKRGTRQYSAPETLNETVTVPTSKGDVYSFAMTIWEIFTGRLPYYDLAGRGNLYTVVFLQRIRPPYPPQAACLGLGDESDEIWKLMEKCWTHEADDRPEMTSVQERLNKIRGMPPKEFRVKPSKWPLDVPLTPVLHTTQASPA